MEVTHNFEICKQLSNESYKNNPKDFGDWKLITFENHVLENTPWDKDNPVFKLLNLACVAYKNEKQKEVILAFRGTEGKDCLDFVSDINFVIKKIPIFTQKIARRVYNIVSKKYPDYNFYLTGHSLGGGYAQILGAQLIIENKFCNAITFNAPGTDYALEAIEKKYESVKESTKNKYREELKTRIKNYMIMNDFVGNFRAHIGTSYYMQPFPLDKLRPDGTVETPHGYILSYDEKVLGPIIKHPPKFGTREAWALWCFDVNNKNSGFLFYFIKQILDTNIHDEHFIVARDILESLKVSQDPELKIKLLNSFKYKTEKQYYEIKANI